MSRSTMTKREQKKFEELLAMAAKVQGKSVEEIQVATGLTSVYSFEEACYEAQAVLNFYEYRIAPLMEKDESTATFDKRYRAWRFKNCKNCGEEFAYVFHYDGVAYCSLDCLAEALAKIGIRFTKNRELAKRWGVIGHPAVVSSIALKALSRLYENDFPAAFSQQSKDHPNNLPHRNQPGDTETLPDNQNNSSESI